MINKLQKFLFNSSTASPIIVFTVIVWWIQCGKAEIIAEDGTVDITGKAILISLLGIFGLVFSLYSALIVWLGRKKCELVPITVSSVKSKDNWVLGALGAYILPFSNLALKDYNIGLSLSIIIIALLIIALSNIVYPNPLLLLLGRFHFYEVSNVDGGEDFLLISKRKSIKNARTIKKVITLWDYMMIEEA